MQATSEIAESPSLSRAWTIVSVFAPTIFLSALLLFWSEPMVGKMMLPLLGGAASVWITCLLFFQLMLLAGYGYVHVIERLMSVRMQMLVHAALMLTSIAFLPIQFAVRPSTFASTYPTLWLLGTLIRYVAIPFIVVSTTAPLLQNWLSKTSAGSARDPYFLYAVSNAGSLLALLLYPVAIEPRWGVRMQSSAWAMAYGAFAVLVVAAGAMVWKNAAIAPQRFAKREDAPSWRMRLFWTAAAFVPSGLMLAVTNHTLLNLASMPFLWIIPLALYLITFMIAFAGRFHVPLRLLSVVTPIVLLVMVPLVAVSRPVGRQSLWYVLGSHMLVLFIGALLCHTALASRRPAAAHLTEFYFWVALGGALGGVFVAVIAPFAFSTVIEYPLLVAALALFRETRESGRRLNWGDLSHALVMGLLVAGAWYAFKWASVEVLEDLKSTLSVNAVLVLFAYLAQRRRLRFVLALSVLIFGYRIAVPGFLNDYTTLHIKRNFFGVKKVVFDMDSNMRKLLHGDTLHGVESMDPVLNGEPLSYYHETGPVGDIMRLISDRGQQLVGVVGLGTGTMAGWARPERHIRFFDIDPQVIDISRNFFTYLRRCAENCSFVVGDGRLSIEKEPDGKFDVLMLDAFNSDSIPAHLVSREAVNTYLKKLKNNGLILFHVSNRYMDVQSLASAVATDAGLQCLARYDDDEAPTGKASSDYVVAARRTEDFGELNENDNWGPVEIAAGVQPWTDDYSNMLAIVRWR